MDYPTPPTRIVEPAASPETAVPTPALPPACPECTEAGNEALARTAQRSRKGAAKPEPAPDRDSDSSAE